MRKYYLNDGQSQQGPFYKDKLKAKGINLDTFIWFNSLSKWPPARAFPESKVIFNSAPPSFTNPSPPQFNHTLSSYYEPTSDTTPKNRRPFIIGLSTKDVSICNIQPNITESVRVPVVNRGTRIETRITKITSKSPHFCYYNEYEHRYNMDVSGNEGPWLCK